MGRQRQPQLRDRLLDACTDHALAHGLPDRLEPFATGTGTSTRMLIYHFGTRDALLRAVLGRARERQRAYYGQLLRPRPDEPYPTTLRRVWPGLTGPAGRPYLRVFGRLREDAEQHLWPGFRREATTDWLGPLTDGLATIGRPELATLVLAVLRGLILDLEATGDTARVDRAFADFLATLGPPTATVSAMPHVVDFVTVSTAGLESSPHPDALAGLRANEARYWKNKYDHTFTVVPAADDPATVEYVHRVLAEERGLVIASPPLEVTSFEVGGLRMAYVFYESGLAINVMYAVEAGGKRAVGFKLSDGMDVPAELEPKFKFARQKSKLAGTIRGSYFVIKGEY